MASSTEGRLAKHLECPICLEKFEEPKILSCQHSYCKKCLEKWVIRLNQEDYKIACPECRQITEVPGGDVNRLPPNYLIGELLSLHDDIQRIAKSSNCAKHDGETLKLFCQTCEQPICRDCTIIDHQGHRYLFIKDVFVAEKEKIIKTIQESKTTISALESSVARVDEKEYKLQENSLRVCQEIDSFIAHQIEILRAEGEHLKNELQKPILAKKEEFHAQKDSLFLSLGCLKSTVEFTEQALSRGDEVAVLKAKGQLPQQLKQGIARARIKPLDTIFCTLEINSSLDRETVKKMAYIRTHDEEYKLSTYGGNFGYLEETYVDKDCYFVISKKKYKFSLDTLRRLSSSETTRIGCSVEQTNHHDNCAQVRITSPRSMHPWSLILKGEGDCFFFSYRPDVIGTYTIEIVINGHYVHGCPFDWIVKEFVIAKNYTKMEDEFD